METSPPGCVHAAADRGLIPWQGGWSLPQVLTVARRSVSVPEAESLRLRQFRRWS